MTALLMGLCLALGLISSLGGGGFLGIFISILAFLLNAVLSAGFVLYCMAIRRGERAEYLTLHPPSARGAPGAAHPAPQALAVFKEVDEVKPDLLHPLGGGGGLAVGGLNISTGNNASGRRRSFCGRPRFPPRP